jgi:hypothetical protein
VLQALNQTIAHSGRDAMLSSARSQFDDSMLVPDFLRMAPSFERLISPWFLGGPPILSEVPT